MSLAHRHLQSSPNPSSPVLQVRKLRRKELKRLAIQFCKCQELQRSHTMSFLVAPPPAVFMALPPIKSILPPGPRRKRPMPNRHKQTAQLAGWTRKPALRSARPGTNQKEKVSPFAPNILRQTLLGCH